MLIIKCAACKTKLWKYKKIGPGKVLRCHKSRIVQFYKANLQGEEILCPCGQKIGLDQGSYYKMISKSFTYTGTKDHK